MIPYKILIVDDSLTIRMQIARLLDQNGFSTILAKDGMKCLEILEHEEPDIILLDIVMPEMDGIEVCTAIKNNKKWEKIPILLITSVSDTENKVKGLYAGADDYITKPFEEMELMARINVIMRNKKLQDELRNANQKIIQQQKSVIQEERLKVLLQMSGSTALELDQPINDLLETIKKVRVGQDISLALNAYIEEIEGIGDKISKILRKMQSFSMTENFSVTHQSDTFLLEKEIFIHILDPSDEDALYLQQMLNQEQNTQLSRSENISQAIHHIKNNPVDIVLMEYHMPDGTSHDFLSALIQDQLDIPTIVVTSVGDEMIAAQMIQAGAYNYISKDRIKEHMLYSIVSNALEKAQLKKDLKEAQKKVAQMSIRDSLTELYNRRYFDEVLETTIEKANRHQFPFVLCILDLDFFKKINDTFGHPAGDMVLIETSRMIKNSIKEKGIAFRYGGEEFSIIIKESKIESVYSLFEELRNKIMTFPYRYKKERIRITASFGLAEFSPTLFNSEKIIAKADKALYQAKNSGRNRIVFGS